MLQALLRCWAGKGKRDKKGNWECKRCGIIKDGRIKKKGALGIEMGFDTYRSFRE
jgi:hypothetical protein